MRNLIRNPSSPSKSFLDFSFMNFVSLPPFFLIDDIRHARRSSLGVWTTGVNIVTRSMLIFFNNSFNEPEIQ